MVKKCKVATKPSKNRELLEKMRRKVRLSVKEREEFKKRVWVERLIAMADVPLTVNSEKLSDICGAVADKIFEKGF